jgi:hypothetical protein
LASGNFSLALGSGFGVDGGATAAGDSSIAIGRRSVSSAAFATAIGAFSSSTGTNATAIGTDSNAYGNNSIAIGRNAVANSPGGVAVGTDAFVSQNASGAFAFPGATAAEPHSVVAVGRIFASDFVITLRAPYNTWLKSGDGLCTDSSGSQVKYGNTTDGDMISWTREGGGTDDSLEVCKLRCENATGCESFTRDSSDGECILYTAAYTISTLPIGSATSWECWHRSADPLSPAQPPSASPTGTSEISLVSLVAKVEELAARVAALEGM